MSTHLRKRLERSGLSQAELARRIGVSTASISLCVSHGKTPKSRPQLAKEISSEIKKQNAQSVSSERSTAANAASTDKEVPMLLRKQTITPAARKHFGLFRDPFTEDVTSADDVFLSPDIRYTRESMWATAKHGGLLAVIGESGAGKTTLRRDLLDRIQREQASMVVIEPYVLSMEESDVKGKTLKSAHIAEAIISAVSPLESPKRSPEARARQLHQLLKNSHRSGNRHVLIIEEAHCLPTATLKHLKRFFELEDGFKKLLAIILIGQPELRLKLSEKNAEVREVVQRCEIVELAPLDNQLGDYIKFKLERVGAKYDQVFETGAIDALRDKLTFSTKANRSFGHGQATSLLYPLAVSNVLSAAMNMAVSIGAPQVSADIVHEV